MGIKCCNVWKYTNLFQSHNFQNNRRKTDISIAYPTFIPYLDNSHRWRSCIPPIQSSHPCSDHTPSSVCPHSPRCTSSVCVWSSSAAPSGWQAHPCLCLCGPQFFCWQIQTHSMVVNSKTQTEQQNRGAAKSVKHWKLKFLINTEPKMCFYLTPSSVVKPCCSTQDL